MSVVSTDMCELRAASLTTQIITKIVKNSRTKYSSDISITFVKFNSIVYIVNVDRNLSQSTKFNPSHLVFKTNSRIDDFAHKIILIIIGINMLQYPSKKFTKFVSFSANSKNDLKLCVRVCRSNLSEFRNYVKLQYHTHTETHKCAETQQVCKVATRRMKKR